MRNLLTILLICAAANSSYADVQKWLNGFSSLSATDRNHTIVIYLATESGNITASDIYKLEPSTDGKLLIATQRGTSQSRDLKILIDPTNIVFIREEPKR